MASSEPLSSLKVGPQVRIRLPPAASQVRTCLSREFIFLRLEARWATIVDLIRFEPENVAPGGVAERRLFEKPR
jgi:hypothetical protein